MPIAANISLAAGDNQTILERVWAGAEWFSDLVKVVATLTADGQLGIVLLGRLQDNSGFGVDLLKAVTKLRDTFSDDQVQCFFCLQLLKYITAS
jgi:hypothetical protein